MGFNRKPEIPPKITKAQLSVSTGNAVGYPLDGVNISPATTLSEYRIRTSDGKFRDRPI